MLFEHPDQIVRTLRPNCSNTRRAQAIEGLAQRAVCSRCSRKMFEQDVPGAEQDVPNVRTTFSGCRTTYPWGSNQVFLVFVPNCIYI